MQSSRNILERLIILTTFLAPMAYAEPGLISWMDIPPPGGYLFVFGWIVSNNPFAITIYTPFSMFSWSYVVTYLLITSSWLVLGIILVMNTHRISKGEPYTFFIKVSFLISLFSQILIPPILLQFIYSYDYIIPLPIPSTIAILGLTWKYMKRM